MVYYVKVTELNLDNVRTVGEFEGLTEEFVNLENLSVVKAGLTSFKGFPKLSKLTKVLISQISSLFLSLIFFFSSFFNSIVYDLFCIITRYMSYIFIIL